MLIFEKESWGIHRPRIKVTSSKLSFEAVLPSLKFSRSSRSWNSSVRYSVKSGFNSKHLVLLNLSTRIPSLQNLSNNLKQFEYESLRKFCKEISPWANMCSFWCADLGKLVMLLGIMVSDKLNIWLFLDVLLNFILSCSLLISVLNRLIFLLVNSCIHFEALVGSF